LALRQQRQHHKATQKDRKINQGVCTMESQKPILVYVEDDENSILVMKMVVERVMKLPTLYVLQSRADFVQQVKGLGVVPDVFLLDIQMKPYDGVELLSMLRKDPQFKCSKVIALTASVTNEEVSLLKSGGFDGAIAKPLNIEVFPDLIARIINGEHVWYIA
jgi:CheY-like chemotaxis protein